jgi:hypothetical protein
MTAEPTRTPVTRAESTAATREAIVHGAHRLFFERHYEDVTFAEIATAAGVSHQTVLNHFESKEGVVSYPPCWKSAPPSIRGPGRSSPIENPNTTYSDGQLSHAGAA